ncbi:hypothetical protein CPB84DRAFT_1795642, partial [Gymnopilus junonius]
MQQPRKKADVKETDALATEEISLIRLPGIIDTLPKIHDTSYETPDLQLELAREKEFSDCLMAYIVKNCKKHTLKKVENEIRGAMTDNLSERFVLEGWISMDREDKGAKNKVNGALKMNQMTQEGCRKRNREDHQDNNAEDSLTILSPGHESKRPRARFESQQLKPAIIHSHPSAQPTFHSGQRMLPNGKVVEDYRKVDFPAMFDAAYEEAGLRSANLT